MRVPSPLRTLVLPVVFCSAGLAQAQAPAAGSKPPDTFRILETLDEHFYAPIFEYHWSYSGFGLKDPVLEKVYRTNALEMARRAAKTRPGDDR